MKTKPEDFRFDGGGVATDQRHGAAMLFEGGPERREILPLAVAAEDNRDLAPHTLDRRQRGADVGSLGIINIADTADFGDGLDAVRQASE